MGVFCVLLGLGLGIFAILYRFFILPYRTYPYRFRTETHQYMRFYLYSQGKWNRELLFPFTSVDFPLEELAKELGVSPENLPAEIHFQPVDGYLQVTSDQPLLIQGVERSTGWIQPDSVVRFSVFKIVYKGTLTVKERVQASRNSLLEYYAPLVGSISIAVFFLTYGLSSVFSSSVSSPSAETSSLPPCLNVPTQVSIPESVSKQSSIVEPVPVSTMYSSKKVEPLPEIFPNLTIIPPGAPLPSRTFPLLFIHAHPDDESLEFGTLMSLCTDAGISTATVLLTDGENGIFRSDYGGPRKGLREIRIREAAWALYTLGSSLYLRMGLSNHPYNSIRDEKRGEQILTLWDSERTMDRIIEILDTFRPDVVVSPEAPSSIRKHFEHEATALLVSRAIEKLRARGASYPRAYLQSLDPRYADRYNRKLQFSRAPVLERQRQALSFHRTQRDASFGIQRIEQFPEESYQVQFWELPVEPHTYFQKELDSIDP